MNVLCRLGIHSYLQTVRSGRPPGTPENTSVCRRCGRHSTGFLAAEKSLWWGGTTGGITVGQLRAALQGVPDDVEVEVESNGLTGWAGAESAYLTTKTVALATDDPRTVPVVRIAGGERTRGVGWAPGMGG